MTKSSLLKSWRLIKFGTVVDNINETTRDPASIGLDRVVGLDHMDPESLPLKRWDKFSDLHEGTSFTRVFRSGQVLFGKRRAYQRKVSVPDFDGICSGDILVFQPKNEELLSEFLPFLVQSDGFFDHALGTSAGSLSPRTKWLELAKYEFALPPIAEQHRIVEVISNIDETIEAYSAIRVDDFKKFFLFNFFSSAARGFVEIQLDKCSEIDMGQSPPGSSYNSERDGIPFLQGSAEFGKRNPVPKKWTHAPTKIVREGDLLLSVRAPVGDINIADQQICIGRGLARVRATDVASAEYLKVCLEYGKADMLAASGTGMFSSISGANLRKLKLQIPPQDIQQDLIDRVLKIDQISDSIDTTVQRLRTLRKSYLVTQLEAVNRDV